MLEKIQSYLEEINAFVPASGEEAEQFRIRFLGRKGIIPALFDTFKSLPPEEKKVLGKSLNVLKQAAAEKVETFKAGAGRASGQGKQEDLSLPGEPSPTGGRHPISLVEKEITAIFSRLGFNVAEGPEIEDDWHNFSALNFPAEHPARDMQDTFFIRRDPADPKADMALRTHTSSVQVRLMENGKPPFRAIMPGRVYRNEAISARAHCFFHQVEGLYVDEHVSFADLKQTLFYFVQELFGEGTGVRFRPSYFPFTEPSAEMDISCTICKGSGCTMCKQSGWVEILGCGMVDPNVLKNCGVDPERYSGFAFGMGIERITNLKYQVTDLRLFSENDVRFLSQFQSEIV
ncbi:phenylalanyl-tRNA synthetase alpha subunit [Anseongella ginsenosidimutans]|uniref:Phenylalanine--tRNA ligase alpha subunit n=1 Tax=Anseongella ginsenosidimutans TaxID=496056 RepID=A0A4R3L0K2_9SPHI|nr:phenylalanine--tRNA ligase subunit alpha [Anseongella ginsenosidimutans]QEC50924.1 phenylalanine--tRNA ligase subunit alpha [Anseongella ginsenosidimutans]TCS90440.1 phenylalanyl-tRNA synthetase alpha subunit [Anseongella ginsenosidimutans]